MIGRGGFHGLLRNLRVSPWTRRSLTESLLLNRAKGTPESQKPTQEADAKPLTPSASLTFRAWVASVAATLHHDAEVNKKDKRR